MCEITGGISFYSTRRGFACDLVVEFEIVTADGEVTYASATKNSDLFVALKGGTNNFGIVTSISMRTFKSEELWGGVSYYMPTAYNEIMSNLCDFTLNEPDEDTHIFCAIGFAFGNQGVSTFMYSTKGEEQPAAFKRFTSIEPQIKQLNSMRKASQIAFVDELSGQTTDGIR